MIRTKKILVFFSLLFLITTVSAAENFYPGKHEDTNANTSIKGFSPSPYFNEQTLSFNYEPEIKIEINAPGASEFNPDKKVMLAFYALPNMNTIAETIGRKVEKGDDWHYNIQHIGAQTRFLRNTIKDYNLVVVYMGTDENSWPWWKMRHPGGDLITRHIVDSVKNIFKNYNVEVTLCSHSGGGEFVFGYLNSLSSIPNDVKRISFIDSEYYYSDSLKYGGKIVSWLKARSDHYLCLIAYDDRDVIIDGKNIGTLDGGTFYRTTMMKNRLAKDFELKDESDSLFTKFTGLNNRIEIYLKSNPDHLMWHTVLVENNGFIHSMLAGTPLENKGYVFWGPRAYSQYIQP